MPNKDPDSTAALTDSSWDSWWTYIKIPLLIFIVLAALGAFTGLDRWIAHALFFDEAGSRWVGANNFWLNDVIHDGGVWFVRGIALAAIVAWACSFVFPRLRQQRRAAAYVAIAMLLGGGLVGAAKLYTNVHCPWSLTEFGGQMPYVHLFSHRPYSEHGRCFPAAHASAGYCTLVFYFVFRERSRRRARIAMMYGLCIALIFGFAQEARGAHFLSHDVWSGFSVWAIVSAVYVFGFRSRLWAAEPGVGTMVHSTLRP